MRQIEQQGRTPVMYPNLFLGIDRSVRPHLLAEGKWYDSLDMRFSRGRATVREFLTAQMFVELGNPWPVTNLLQIPTGTRNRVKLVAMTPTGVYRIPSTTSPSLGEAVDRNVLFYAPDITRWATATIRDRVYFSNVYNQVHWTDGTKLTRLVSSPKARHLALFFDHLVAADVMYEGQHYPQRVAWSDLYKLDKWAVGRGGEADYYDCVDTQSPGDKHYGTMGLHQIGDVLFIYTPSHIHAMTYRGLPRVMKVDTALRDIGCDYPYGIAPLDKVHFFVSDKARNFFAFDGATARTIGEAIAEYYFNDVTTFQQYRRLTWAYVDVQRDEVGWVYCSKANLDNPGLLAFNPVFFDKRVVFNYRENTWYPFSAPNLYSFLRVGGATIPVGASVSTMNSLEGTFDNMDEYSPLPEEVMWGGGSGQVLKEGGFTTQVESVEPYLETGDLIYNDMYKVSEVESLIINATKGNAMGVKVEVSARESVDDAVVFTALPQLWTEALPERRLSFARVAGKVIRYRFSPALAASPGDKVLDVGMLNVIEAQAADEDEIIITEGDGRYTVPDNGEYEVEIVGAGGGGGAKSIVTPVSNEAAGIVPSATLKNITLLSDEKYSATIVRASFSNSDFTHFNTGENGKPLGLAPIGFLDDGVSSTPSEMVTQEVRDWLYMSAITYIKANASAILGGGTFLEWLSFFWSKHTYVDGTQVYDHFYNASDYKAGSVNQLSLTPGQSIWFPRFYFSYVPAGSHSHLQRAGGGAGGYLLLRISVLKADVPYFYYSVGSGTDNVVYLTGAGLPMHSRGGAGTRSRLWFPTGPKAFDFIANGGTGGGWNGAAVVDGVGGTVSVSDPGVIIQQTYFSLAGDNAVAESLPGQVAQGGFPRFRRNAIAMGRRSPDGTGYTNGGGGSGQKRGFESALQLTTGGIGYIAIRRRRALA